MSKKKRAVLITGYVAAAFLVLGGFLLRLRTENLIRDRYIRHSYQHAFAELVNAVEDVDSALQKCVYATSPSMISTVCTQVYGKAAAAEMALSELPNSCYDLGTVSSFITKVGDYAFALSRNASRGSGYTDEEYGSLASLSETAGMLSEKLTGMYGDMQRGAITVGELSRAGYAAGQTGEASVSFNGLGDGFKMIDTRFPEIPSLIYDGPFSDHISDREPEMLKGAEEVSEARALEIAAEFTDLRPGAFAVGGKIDGDLPVYSFTAGAYGGSVTVEVTSPGGFVSYYENTRMINESSMERESAAEAAQSFLVSRGYEGMTPTYYTVDSGALTVNFAYAQNGVVFYNDLIKVTVAMDNGTVVGFEAKGYLMCHSDRDIPEPQVTAEEAEELVNRDLNILSRGMAVIPTMGKNEVLCHEFKCENREGRHYIIYVNAVTGEQENILILIEDEKGTLTV